MKNKKGQGLSMNVIIIASIALLILVILSVLVIKSGGTLTYPKYKNVSCDAVYNGWDAETVCHCNQWVEVDCWEVNDTDDEGNVVGGHGGCSLDCIDGYKTVIYE